MVAGDIIRENPVSDESLLGKVWQGVASTQNKPDSVPSGRVNVIPITSELVARQAEMRRAQSSVGIEGVDRFLGNTSSQIYRLGVGDVLNVSFLDYPELAGTTQFAKSGTAKVGVGDESYNSGYTVDAKGIVGFPYAGNIQVLGKSAAEVREVLVQRLSKYFRNPQVTTQIAAYRSKRVYVDGEVKQPGPVGITDIPMTLAHAIAQAGGFTDKSDRTRVSLIRDKKTTQFNLNKLAERGIPPTRLLLQHGDMVKVENQEDLKVFVMGEVVKPSSQVMRNGRRTLNQALGEAGGVNPTSGDASQVFVIRSATSAKPTVFHLNAVSPMSFTVAERFELMPSDVVYIDPVPLARWNRVISLILPSAQAVVTTQTLTGN